MWDPGGETHPPTIQGTYTKNLVGGLWRVTSTNLSRSNPFIVYWVPPTSQFYYKIQVHEEVHYNQWLPGGLNADLYSPTELSNRLMLLFADTEPHLQTLINGTIYEYLAEQQYLSELSLPQMEEEAYFYSDEIPPLYLYMNCGRY
jgi:hypothetical protein